jgi:thiamine biosynthesis lipoprotein
MRTFFILCLLLFINCQKKELYSEKHTFYRMDTVINITIVIGTAKNPEKPVSDIDSAWNRIDSLLEDFEKRFSQTHPESEVLRINSRQDSIVSVTPILAEMLDVGLRYGDTLNGLFDLTIFPIKQLWGFDEKAMKKVIPPDGLLQELLKLVDYKKVTVDTEENTIRFQDPGMIIDVGGIAKGFALRELSKLLDTLNYCDYLVVAGGDIISAGTRPDGKSWRIGVQHPRDPNKPLGVFPLDSGSVVTSGDYERYWIKDGKRFHHIFNPKTGYSCTKNRSLTVWGMDPVIVDVLSTGLFGLPRDDIHAFINARSDLECIVVDSLGDITVSSGWVGKVKFEF